MPVACVFAITDVGHQQQVWYCPLDRAQRSLNNSVFGVRTRSDFIFFGGNTKQDDTADPEVAHFAALLHDTVDGKLRVSRHRRDLAADIVALTDEKREYQIRGVDFGLANKCAQALGAAKAAHSMNRKRHGYIQFYGKDCFELLGITDYGSDPS